MKNRKYKSYSVATEFEESIYTCYREALSKYRREDSATLYGMDEFGGISIILSK